MADTVRDLAAIDFATVSPQEFARIVKGLSREEITALAKGDLRVRVLREVFGRMERQFRPQEAGSLDALIRWKVTGETEAVYETTITGGTCSVHEGRGDADPRVTLVMGDVEFLRLVSGNASPVTLFVTRKLRIAGDMALASGLTRLFDIPKA